MGIIPRVTRYAVYMPNLEPGEFPIFMGSFSDEAQQERLNTGDTTMTEDIITMQPKEIELQQEIVRLKDELAREEELSSRLIKARDGEIKNLRRMIEILQSAMNHIVEQLGE